MNSIFALNQVLFLYIAGFFTAQPDYMIAEAKRIFAETGLKHPAYSMRVHPAAGDNDERVRKVCEVFSKVKAGLEGTGVEPGILVQSTLGHGWPGKVITDAPWTFVINQTGGTVYRQCPLDPGFREYVARQFTRIAQTHPAFILIDDDLRAINNSQYGVECFCERHVAEFNKRVGRTFTSDELREYLKKADDKDEYLLAFEALRRETLLGFAKLIREAVNVVDENIPCGYCAGGGEFYLMEEMARTLAGKNPAFLRIHNANYLESSPHDFAPCMYRSALTHKFAASVEYQLDESDTCPHNRYSKSAISMHAHIVGGILNGLTGGKLWITNTGYPFPEDGAEYEKIIAEHRGFYNTLMMAVKSAKWQGPVTVLPDKKNCQNPFKAQRVILAPRDWQSSIFDRFGIPGLMGDYMDGRVHLLTSELMQFMDDATLEKHLTGKVLLDSSAALELQKRGFGKLLGATLKQEPFRCQGEREVGNPRHMTFNIDSAVPQIVPGPKSEVFSNFYTADGILGPACVISTNEKGGKVAITSLKVGCTPYNWLTPFRKDYFLRIIEKLDGKPVEYVCTTYQDVYLRHGIMPDGSNLVALVNTNFDALKGVHLRINSPVKSVEILGGDGAWKVIPFTQDKTQLNIQKDLACYECAAFRIVK